MALQARSVARIVLGAKMASGHGLQVNPENIHAMIPDMTLALIQEGLDDERVLRGLDELGLTASRKPEVTAQQHAALSIYMDMSIKADHRRRLQLAGVTPRQWEGWLANPVFQAALDQISEERMAAHMPRAKMELAGAADRGERWAVEMLFEVQGRHDRRQVNVDMRALLGQIFGILDENGVDQATLTKIATQIRGAMGQQAPVMQITESPMEVRNELHVES